MKKVYLEKDALFMHGYNPSKGYKSDTIGVLSECNEN